MPMPYLLTPLETMAKNNYPYFIILVWGEVETLVAIDDPHMWAGEQAEKRNVDYTIEAIEKGVIYKLTVGEKTYVARKITFQQDINLLLSSFPLQKQFGSLGYLNQPA